MARSSKNIFEDGIEVVAIVETPEEDLIEAQKMFNVFLI